MNTIDPTASPEAVLDKAIGTGTSVKATLDDTSLDSILAKYGKTREEFETFLKSPTKKKIPPAQQKRGGPRVTFDK